MAKGRYGPACDIWSGEVATVRVPCACLNPAHAAIFYIGTVGVIAYLCLSIKISFEIFVEDIKHLVKTGKFVFKHPTWTSVSGPAKDFIASLLTMDQHARPTAQSALEHPWLVEEMIPERPSIPNPPRSQDSIRVDLNMQRSAMAIIRCLISLTDARQGLENALTPLGLSFGSQLTQVEVKKVYVSRWFANHDGRLLVRLFLTMAISESILLEGSRRCSLLRLTSTRRCQKRWQNHRLGLLFGYRQ